MEKNNKCQNLFENYKKLLEIKDGFDFVNIPKEKIKILKYELLKSKNLIRSIKELMSGYYEHLQDLISMNLQSKEIREKLGLHEKYFIKPTSIIESEGKIVVSITTLEPLKFDDIKIDPEYYKEKSSPLNKHNLFLCYFDPVTLEMIEFIDFKKDIDNKGKIFNSNCVFSDHVYIEKTTEKDFLILDIDNVPYIFNKTTKELKRLFNKKKNNVIVSYRFEDDLNFYGVSIGHREIIVRNKLDKSRKKIICPDNFSWGHFIKTSDGKAVSFSAMINKNQFVPDDNDPVYFRYFDKDLNLISDIKITGILYKNFYHEYFKIEESLDRKYFFASIKNGFGAIDKETGIFYKIVDNDYKSTEYVHEFSRVVVKNFLQTADGKYIILFYSNPGIDKKIKIINAETLEVIDSDYNFIEESEYIGADMLADGKLVCYNGTRISVIGNKNE